MGEKECVICLDSCPAPTPSGCACRGEAGLAHATCLVANAVSQREHRGDEAWFKCQTCKQEFTGAMARAWGDMEPKNGNAQLFLAAMLRSCGKYAAAARIGRAVVFAFRKELGDEHEHTLRSMSSLAVTLGHQGKHADAESILREVTATQRRIGDVDGLFSSEINLASSTLKLKKYADAESAFRVLACRIEREFGAEHTKTLQAKCNPACSLDYQGKLSEADVIHNEVNEIRRRTLGAEHPETLLGQANMASARLSRYSDAEGRLRNTLSVMRRALGEEHPYVTATARNLARFMHPDRGSPGVPLAPVQKK
jgi:hypothetical protein